MADIQKENNWIITSSLVVLAVFACGVALRYTRIVMVPFVLAVFVFMLVTPILDFMVIRFRLPRPIAVILSLVVVLVIIAFVCLLIGQAIQIIVATIGRYSNSFANLTTQIFTKLDRWGFNVEESNFIDNLRNEIPQLVTGTAGRVVSFFSSLTLVLIFVGFMLAGRKPHPASLEVYRDIESKMRRYISIKVVISSVTGVLVWLILKAIGLELAGVFGIFAFLLNFIPSLGSIISTLLPIPIAVAQFQNPWMIVLVVALPGTVQMVVGNIIEPKLMGEGLNLHPVTILLALSFWGLLWGVTGMFLAAPITAIIRAVLMQFETFAPVGRLMAGVLPSSQTRSDR